MKREQVVSLLKEITFSCESFRFAQAVSIARNPETEGYLLRVKWVPNNEDKNCLRALLVKYGVEVTQKDDFLVFHRPKTLS